MVHRLILQSSYTVNPTFVISDAWRTVLPVSIPFNLAHALEWQTTERLGGRRPTQSNLILSKTTDLEIYLDTYHLEGP